MMVRPMPTPAGNPVEAVVDLLRCPACDTSLRSEDEALICASGHEVPFLDGRIPDLAADIAQRETIGQWAMRLRPLVQIYERLWRPAFTLLAGGRNPDAETRRLAEWLGVAPDAAVLDVACGPGNTTRRIADAVPRGRVLGVDLSVPMLERAVTDTTGKGPPVVYARMDAHRLAIPDGIFDGAHCAAALYLVSDPARVVADVARVLRPDAWFVGMTLAPVLPVGMRMRAALAGVRYVSSRDLERYCESAGLVSFHSERRGAAVLFRARQRS